MVIEHAAMASGIVGSRQYCENVTHDLGEAGGETRGAPSSCMVTDRKPCRSSRLSPEARAGVAFAAAHTGPGAKRACGSARHPNNSKTCRRHRRNTFETDGYRPARLLPQGRRLPVGVPGPHPGSRIHPPDRGRAATATPTSSTGNPTSFPGILGRTCDRPCEPACRRGRVEEGGDTEGQVRAGRDLPAEARRRRLQGRHPRSAARSAAAKRNGKRDRAGRRRSRVADGRPRPRAARLRMRACSTAMRAAAA